MNTDLLTVFTWFHAKSNPLDGHNLFGLAKYQCAHKCFFQIVVGDMLGGSTGNTGKIGFWMKGLSAGWNLL